MVIGLRVSPDAEQLDGAASVAKLTLPILDLYGVEDEIQKAAGRVLKTLETKGGEGKFHRKD